MDTPQQSPVILSLCPGSGGLETGLEMALGKLKIAAYVEIETFIIYNLLARMEKGILDPAPIWSDITTFDAAPFCGRLHGITAGYPCQPFSNSGSRKGTTDPRHLWPYIERTIRTAQPVFGFFENVSGHLSLGFDTVAASLQSMGYTVEAGLFAAVETGAPHIRTRLFILAVHMGYAHYFRQYWEHWRQSAEQLTHASTHLPHAHSLRPQSQRTPAQQQPQNPHYGIDSRWPSPRGIKQKRWEAKRTIEPGMGCTVNGYNYREDLLRMYGNAVVPAQAAYAFKTLADTLTHLHS